MPKRRSKTNTPKPQGFGFAKNTRNQGKGLNDKGKGVTMQAIHDGAAPGTRAFDKGSMSDKIKRGREELHKQEAKKYGVSVETIKASKKK